MRERKAAPLKISPVRRVILFKYYLSVGQAGRAVRLGSDSAVLLLSQTGHQHFGGIHLTAINDWGGGTH